MARATRNAGVEDPVEGTRSRSQKAPAKSAAKAPASRKSAAQDDLAGLAGLLLETKELEDEQRALSGGDNTWIRIVQTGTDVTTKGTDSYIKGAEVGDFLISDKNTVLKEPEITVLGMFKVYAQKKPSGRDSEMDHTVGFWLPGDAEQIPLEAGSNFKRSLGNGDYLIPMHWMFIYIHEYPEIKDALIPFQSIGNSFYNEILKVIKKNSIVSTEIRLRLFSVAKKNESFNKTYFYPAVEVIGKNFDVDEDTGSITPVKGGLSVEEIKEVVTRSNEAHRAYKELKMVTHRNENQILALLPPESHTAPARRGLPGTRNATASYEDEEEDETPNF